MVDVDDDNEGDDEGDEEDANDGLVAIAYYNTLTHVCVPIPTYDTLINSKTALDERSLQLVEADAKRAESLFTGFATSTQLYRDQVNDAHTHAKAQRDLADGYQRRVAELDRQNADLVRQSEDARVERERMAAEIKRGEMALERLQLELQAKVRQRQIELDALRQAGAPVFAAAGKGLGLLMSGWASGMPGMAGGVAGGLPTGSPPNGSNGATAGAAAGSSASANGSAPPQEAPALYDVSAANTDEFRQVFHEVFASLKPEALGCLRAIVCSYALAQAGAPPLPKNVPGKLMALVQSDAGDARVMTLLHHVATQSYAPRQPEASASGPEAPN